MEFLLKELQIHTQRCTRHEDGLHQLLIKHKALKEEIAIWVSNARETFDTLNEKIWTNPTSDRLRSGDYKLGRHQYQIRWNGYKMQQTQKVKIHGAWPLEKRV